MSHNSKKARNEVEPASYDGPPPITHAYTLVEKLDIDTATQVLCHPCFSSLMIDRPDGTKNYTLFRSYQTALSVAKNLGTTEDRPAYLPVKYTRLEYGRYKAVVNIADAERGFPVYQSMWRELRSAAAAKYYWDLDISNAQPTIMLQLCTRYRIDLPLLSDYVQNRDSWFTLVQDTLDCCKETAKNLFIRMMFGGRPCGWAQANHIRASDIPTRVHQLCAELEGASIALLRLPEFASYLTWFRTIYTRYRQLRGKPVSSDARKSKIAILLQDFERRCVDAMMAALDEEGYCCGGIIHDGLHIERPLDEDGNPVTDDIPSFIVSKLRDAVTAATDFVLELKVKPFEIPSIYMNQIVPSPQIIPVRPDDWEKTDIHEWTYEQLKEYWEQTFIKITDKGIFVRVDHDAEEKVRMLDERALISGQKHLHYTAVYRDERTQKLVSKRESFVYKWIMDPAIRREKFISFSPPGNTIRPNTFNMWTGFDAERFTSTPEAIDLVQTHVLGFISMLFRKDKVSIDYFLDWAAQLFQQPGKKIGIAYILRGKFGCGKNVLIDILGRLVGQAMLLEVSDPKTKLFGNFTALRAGRMLIAINEASGFDIHAHDDLLKDMITSGTFCMEKKHVDATTMNSFERYIFTSNGENPVRVIRGDRRYVIEDVSTEREQDQDYFAELQDITKRPEVIRAFYDYLMKRDISNRRWIADRPKTSAVLEAYELNMQPEERWLRDLVVRENNKQAGIIYTKSSSDFYKEFQSWLDENRIRYQVDGPRFGIRLNRYADENSSMYMKGAITRKRVQGSTTYDINIDAAAKVMMNIGWIVKDELRPNF